MIMIALRNQQKSLSKDFHIRIIKDFTLGKNSLFSKDSRISKDSQQEHIRSHRLISYLRHDSSSSSSGSDWEIDWGKTMKKDGRKKKKKITRCTVYMRS